MHIEDLIGLLMEQYIHAGPENHNAFALSKRESERSKYERASLSFTLYSRP